MILFSPLSLYFLGLWVYFVWFLLFWVLCGFRVASHVHPHLINGELGRRAHCLFLYTLFKFLGSLSSDSFIVP